jgi:hypothetical protein
MVVYKISLIGHHMSGKTNYIKRVLGESTTLLPHVEYKLEVYVIQFLLNNKEKVMMKIYDAGTTPPCIGTIEGYHKNSDGAIVFYGDAGPSLSLLELRAYQSVGLNRSNPVIYQDHSLLTRYKTVEELAIPFTKLIQKMFNDSRLRVVGIEPI